MPIAAKIFSKVKRIANEQVAGSVLGGIIAKKISGNYILMYHGVSKTGSTRFNSRHASIVCFRKQIAFLKKYCSVISLTDFADGKFDPDKPNFAVTFDNGYLNNFLNAKPVLEDYRCPATFFITGLNEVNDNILWADFVNIATTLTNAELKIDGETFRKQGNCYFSQDSGKSIYEIIKHQRADYQYKLKVKEAFANHVHFQDDMEVKEYWQLMNDQQIAETSHSTYIKIGSHGYYHNNLGSLPHQVAVDELVRSKKYLESLVQYEIQELAYPDGSYTPQLVQSARQSGLKIQLAADHFLFNESPDNTNIKKRYGIYSVDSCLNQLFTAIKTAG